MVLKQRIARFSLITIPLVSAMPLFYSSSVLAQQIGEMTRLGCTPVEQSRPLDFPWCASLHSRAIRAIAFSPDGQFLASGSVDKTIKLWNVSQAARGENAQALERTLPASPDQILSIAFSPDGRLLASGGGRFVRLWDWQRGELLQEFSGHTGIVYTVAFSPDGRLLASAGNGNRVNLWEVETGDLETSLGAFVHPIWSIAFTPDGEHLVFSAKRQGFTNEPNHTVRLWNLDGEPEAVLQGHQAEIRAIALSPNGRFLISTSLDNTIKLWDLEMEESMEMPTPHLNEVWALAFNADNRTFASGSADNTIKMWQLP